MFPCDAKSAYKKLSILFLITVVLKLSMCRNENAPAKRWYGLRHFHNLLRYFWYKRVGMKHLHRKLLRHSMYALRICILNEGSSGFESIGANIP